MALCIESPWIFLKSRHFLCFDPYLRVWGRRRGRFFMGLRMMSFCGRGELRLSVVASLSLCIDIDDRWHRRVRAFRGYFRFQLQNLTLTDVRVMIEMITTYPRSTVHFELVLQSYAYPGRNSLFFSVGFVIMDTCRISVYFLEESSVPVMPSSTLQLRCLSIADRWLAGPSIAWV